MFWVYIYSFLSLVMPASAAVSNLSFQPENNASIVVTNHTVQQFESQPDWSESMWTNALIIVLVVCFVFGGAYGIHLYQMRHLHNRADDLEEIVSLRTEEVKLVNHAHEEAISALESTNNALSDTNTLLERANNKLAWANSQLSHSNRLLEVRSAELNIALEQNKEILDITAHDLKNPLGGVLGLTEILQEDLATMPAHENMATVFEHLGLIHMAAKQMLCNVESLLNRQGQERQAPLHKEVVYLNDVILTTLKWNRQQASNKGLKLYFVGRQAKVAVHVDVSAIRRVLDNLISNAIKYSALHGKIWVEVLKQKGEVWVSVRDQGPGLTEEDMNRVFGRNEQLSAKPTAGEHSSGFGLYIVKQLIEQHGGEVGVESMLGEGAAFWFKIDAVDAVEHLEAPLVNTA